MGAFMKEDDIYIGTFIDLFNIRFAPKSDDLLGGIQDMRKLQNEFKIFAPGRPFSLATMLLGLSGFTNDRAKNRWQQLLQQLPGKGDQLISDALAENLAKKVPLPCYMKSHFLKDDNRVIITEADHPLFYLEQPYLTISLPMAPRPQGGVKKSKKKKR